MPPHPGGQVVDPEEVSELLRLVDPALHRVKELQLSGQQRLVAPGQIAEHVIDPAADPVLVNGGGDGGPLNGVERPPDLADLIRAWFELRYLGFDVDILAGPQPLDRARQSVTGQVERGQSKVIQLADEASAHHDADGHRGENRQQSEPAGQDQPQAVDTRLGLGGCLQRGARFHQRGLQPGRVGTYR